MPGAGADASSPHAANPNTARRVAIIGFVATVMMIILFSGGGGTSAVDDQAAAALQYRKQLQQRREAALAASTGADDGDDNHQHQHQQHVSADTQAPHVVQQQHQQQRDVATEAPLVEKGDTSPSSVQGGSVGGSGDDPSAGVGSGSSSTGGQDRVSSSLLPHSTVGTTARPAFTMAMTWADNGDLGWRKPTRRAREALATCPSVVADVEAAHADADKRYRAFQASPGFKMPWYYHDPYPVCGQVLLWHLHGGPKHVYTLRLPSTRQQLPDSSSASAQLVDLRKQAEAKEDATDRLIGGSIDDALETIYATAGELVEDVYIEDCGSCGGAAGTGGTPLDVKKCAEYRDVLITARLVGSNGYFSGRVERVDADLSVLASRLRVSFRVDLPGVYALEVKVVHSNGESNDPQLPKSLGVIGIRAVDHNRKAFKYNGKCDEQRHVFGSPIRVVVLTSAARPALAALPATVTTSVRVPPFCREANHTSGRWVRFTAKSCQEQSNPFCYGNPQWLTDAAAYNTNYLWAPETCRYAFWDPSQGPQATCLSLPDAGRAFLLLVGDSVTREYTKNCMSVNLRSAKLNCLFANIALEGQHYSRDYASSVVRVIIENLKSNNAGVFATNLGIHHMIGPCSTEQWTEFITLFVEEWNREVVWNPQAHRGAAIHSTEAGRTASKSKQMPKGYPKGTSNAAAVKLERAIWIGPPTIHYARKGMGAQRAALWDEIAWGLLAPLGFERLRAIPVTAPRQEGTWDGLHYASERNKVQTRHRNRDVAPRQWNGGVANMLFTMLLNLICHGGPDRQ